MNEFVQGGLEEQLKGRTLQVSYDQKSLSKGTKFHTCIMIVHQGGDFGNDSQRKVAPYAQG